jgi:hypothetical protein
MRRNALQDGRVSIRGAITAIGVLLAVCGPVRVDGAAQETPRTACADVPDALPAVWLHLIDRAGVSIDVRTALEAEALRPWLAAGVRVDWSLAVRQRPAIAGDRSDLYVTLVADDAPSIPATLPMASILFVAGKPTTQITVHAGYVARRLAELRVDDQRLAARPRLVRDRVLGRVLGRAIAHEIGHFLFASSAHSADGLMRASHRLEHLLDPAASPARFQVMSPAIPTCLVAEAAR